MVSPVEEPEEYTEKPEEFPEKPEEFPETPDDPFCILVLDSRSSLGRFWIEISSGSTFWCQCYKTFYGRKLFVPGKLFQPSLMFVGEARNLP
jgi:hypothetical protein